MKRFFLFYLFIASSIIILGCNQNQTEETASLSTQVETEAEANPVNETEPTMQSDYRQIADINKVVDESQNQPVFLFKHSTACPISAAAKEVMDEFVNEGKIPVYMVTVQTDRPMSNTIEEKFDIKHESPQLLILDNGEIKSVFNHYEIRKDHILEALET